VEAHDGKRDLGKGGVENRLDRLAEILEGLPPEKREAFERELLTETEGGNENESNGGQTSEGD